MAESSSAGHRRGVALLCRCTYFAVLPLPRVGFGATAPSTPPVRPRGKCNQLQGDGKREQSPTLTFGLAAPRSAGQRTLNYLLCNCPRSLKSHLSEAVASVVWGDETHTGQQSGRLPDAARPAALPPPPSASWAGAGTTSDAARLPACAANAVPVHLPRPRHKASAPAGSTQSAQANSQSR